MNIQFRPCTPADVALAVPLIISSGPAAFDYIFADTALEQTTAFVSKAFVQGGMEIGYAVHTAMLVDGNVVAVGGFWHHQHVLRFTLAGAWQILRFYGPIAGFRVIFRGLRLETIVKPPKKRVAYLGHFGVNPAYQSQGLGTVLIDELLRQARNKGFTTFALDVSSGNPRAQQLYERLGFVVKKINPANYKTAFGTVVEHRYMEKIDGS